MQNGPLDGRRALRAPAPTGTRLLLPPQAAAPALLVGAAAMAAAAASVVVGAAWSAAAAAPHWREVQHLWCRGQQAAAAGGWVARGGGHLLAPSRPHPRLLIAAVHSPGPLAALVGRGAASDWQVTQARPAWSTLSPGAVGSFACSRSARFSGRTRGFGLGLAQGLAVAFRGAR